MAGLSAVLLLAGASEAQSQELNIRTGAQPGTDSKIAKLNAEADLKAAASAPKTLIQGDLANGVVNQNCGQVQVGGQQIPQQGLPPTTLVGQNEGVNNPNVTVIRGDVINICRQGGGAH